MEFKQCYVYVVERNNIRVSTYLKVREEHFSNVESEGNSVPGQEILISCQSEEKKGKGIERLLQALVMCFC